MTEALTWMAADPGKWMLTGVSLLAIGIVMLIADYLIERRRK